MNVPAEAARLPGGATYTTTGTSETRMRLTISRMAVSSPPGVSSTITTASRFSRSARSMAWEITCAEMGWIAPSTVITSTTGLSFAEMVAFGVRAGRRGLAAVSVRSATPATNNPTVYREGFIARSGETWL